ncbi:uncharacterized protein LOC133901196 [Phragmites australis]|uniref:uncharacterized protein LOC133901196 n=1 Tax=Phragmites australis TaxID=29695 RepID=UPI002D76B289|nr:uncharacterized protein LOC133901196 [Phragmites australis]
MGMEGLIPFVYGAIKKRRGTRRTAHHEFVSSPGSPPTRGRAPERFTGGAYHSHSQSCRFVVAPSLADELDLLHDGDGRAPPEGLPDAPFLPAGDGRGLSRSRRFSSMRVR